MSNTAMSNIVHSAVVSDDNNNNNHSHDINTSSPHGQMKKIYMIGEVPSAGRSVRSPLRNSNYGVGDSSNQ